MGRHRMAAAAREPQAWGALPAAAEPQGQVEGQARRRWGLRGGRQAGGRRRAIRVYAALRDGVVRPEPARLVAQPGDRRWRSSNDGGCCSNDNSYQSRNECEDACQGLGQDLDACTVDTDCQLVPDDPAECCGTCEPADDRSFLALNVKASAQYQKDRCSAVDCSTPCPAPLPGRATSQFFVPTCRTGQCTVIYIRQTMLTACTVDTDCVLRSGTACCERLQHLEPGRLEPQRQPREPGL